MTLHFDKLIDRYIPTDSGWQFHPENTALLPSSEIDGKLVIEATNPLGTDYKQLMYSNIAASGNASVYYLDMITSKDSGELPIIERDLAASNAKAIRLKPNTTMIFKTNYPYNKDRLKKVLCRCRKDTDATTTLHVGVVGIEDKAYKRPDGTYGNDTFYEVTVSGEITESYTTYVGYILGTDSVENIALVARPNHDPDYPAKLLDGTTDIALAIKTGSGTGDIFVDSIELQDTENALTELPQGAMVINSLEGLTDDNKLSPIEKTYIKTLLTEIDAEYTGILASGTAAGVSSTLLTALTTKRNALHTIVDPLLLDMTMASDITSAFDDAFSEYYSAKTAVQSETSNLNSVSLSLSLNADTGVILLTARGVLVTAEIKLTIVSANIPIANVTISRSDAGVLTKIDDYHYTLDCSTVVTDTITVGVTATYLGKSYSSMVSVTKYVDPNKTAYNFGGVTVVPSKLPDGTRLLSGDYFLWVDSNTPAGSTVDPVIAYPDLVKGEVYEYDGTWRASTNRQLYMNLLPEFMDIANTSDDEVIGNAIIKKLATIEAFIHELTTNELTLSQNGSIASSYDDNGEMRRYQKGMINDATLPENFGGFLLEASGYMELVRVRARDGEYSGVLESTDTEGTLLLTQKYELGRQLPVSPKTLYLASEISPIFPNKASKEVSINGGSYVHAFKPSTVTWGTSIGFDVRTLDNSRTVALPEIKSSSKVVLYNSTPYISKVEYSKNGGAFTAMSGSAGVSVSQGDDIRIRQTYNNPNAFVALGQTSRLWWGMTALGNDVYACVNQGDIYKQTNGTGNFVALGQTSRGWRGMTALGNDIYACVNQGDIYKQTNGTGNFIGLGQTSGQWYDMTTLGNDVYASMVGGDIYKQTNGTGNFIALGQGPRNWFGMTTLGNDVYVCESNGDIYKQINGTGNFIALGQTRRSWFAMTTLGNDVYACESNGDIYKQTNGTGNFVALGQGPRSWFAMTTLGNDIYACVYNGDIYKQTYNTAHQSTISIALPNTEDLVLACANASTANGAYDDFNGAVITFDTATSQSEKSVVIKSGSTTLFDSSLNLYRTFKSVYDNLEGIGTYALDDSQSTFNGTQAGYVVKSQNQLTFLTLSKAVIATIGSTTYTKTNATLYLLGQIRGVKTATLLPETGASIGTAQNPYLEGHFGNIVANTFSGSLNGNVTGSLNGNVTGNVTGNVNADAINLGTPSLSANGYTTLPNGVILQWVSLSLGSDSQGLNVTFPIAFSTACVFATIVSSWTGRTTYGWDYVANITTTGCRCTTQAGNPRLLAIGY